MKKKLFLGVLALFIFSVLIINVNARDSLLGIGFEQAAKTPETIPTSGTKLSSTLTDTFDFSRVEFESTNPSTTMYGASDLRKIILGTPNYTGIMSGDISTMGTSAFSSWFTAYCLDGELTYPENSVTTATIFLDAYNTYNTSTDDGEKAQALKDMIGIMTLTAFFNNKELSSPYLNHFKNMSLNYGFSDDAFVLTNGTTVADFSMNSLKTESDKVRNVTITELSFFDPADGIIKYVTSSGGESTTPQTLNIQVSFTATDILFQKYYTTDNLPSTYNHALWILEHSYPSMTLTDFLTSAGVNYDTLKNEIHDLQAHTSNDPDIGNDTAIADLTGDQLNQYVENYVYGTIQYAIWKVYDGKVADDGSKLGGSIKNVGELNKIYQYLIQNRSEYTNYDKLKFNNDFVTKAPASGKEIFKQDSNSYIYGPYKVTYDSLNSKDIGLSLASGIDSTIKIVNASGNEITSIANGGEYYIKIPKAAKVGQVKVNYIVNGIFTFTPEGNRGRIYFPQNVLAQNVITAGRITTADLTGQYDITTNPKTGVENVGVLLLVTLVAFSLGYLVLSFKNKPIGLN